MKHDAFIFEDIRRQLRELYQTFYKFFILDLLAFSMLKQREQLCEKNYQNKRYLN